MTTLSNINQPGKQGPPFDPEKDVPTKPDKNPDPTRTTPAIPQTEPIKPVDPRKNDPTRIDNPPPTKPQQT